MKNKKLLWLPLTLLFVASCNETVSPELKNSNITASGTGGATVVPTEFYIKVTDTSPTPLNFQLHRTGAGNYNKDCKVSSTVPLTNGLYTAEGTASPAIDHDSKVFDVSCYYDMEESGLYNNGFQFDISASANTCEYIGYMPYSYFDRVPGNSTTTYTSVKCDAATTNAAAQGYMGPKGAAISQDKFGTVIACNQLLDTGLAMANAAHTFRSITSDSELCEFDYSRQVAADRVEPGKNCDVGVITVNEYVLSTDTTTLVTSSPATPATRKIICGGKIGNCVRGAITQSARPNSLKMIDYWSTTADTDFKKGYTYSNLISKDRFSTVEYTNFRSQLASQDIDYQQFSNDAFASVWTTDSNRKRFDPNVMEYFAANRKPGSGTSSLIVTDAAYVAASISNGYTARPYAADPFLGLTIGATSGVVKNILSGPDASLVNNRVNPFYVVYCLDAALDIKARIRIVARDWDRTFTSTAALEDISDYRGLLFSPNTISRQDNPVQQEIPNDPGSLNSYNDYYDWDNLIYMSRTAGAYVMTTTTFTPDQGFFNHSLNGIFTNGQF
jgi:hypothetical protein